MVLAIGGAIIGLILVLIASFKPHLSTYLAPAYALFEGLFIGGISAIFEAHVSWNCNSGGWCNFRNFFSMFWIVQI